MSVPVSKIEATVPYFTPVIFWRQKGDIIWAKIVVDDLKEGDYKFEVTKDGFTFIAKAADEKLYWLNMKTYAMIDPRSFTVNLTGQHVEVRFEKYFKGFEWPQLFFDGLHKVKFDPNYNVDGEEENSSLCQKLLDMAELRIKLGLPDHPRYVNNSNIKFCMNDEESEDSDSEAKIELDHFEFENDSTNVYNNLTDFL